MLMKSVVSLRLVCGFTFSDVFLDAIILSVVKSHTVMVLPMKNSLCLTEIVPCINVFTGMDPRYLQYSSI